ncbi:hypothetical protein [Lacticaseibacillus paracasei]|uniref:hypothetical protein n=1 Tax=Lacticaseibacillus paracasei TaxID=1597 RepID=UPI002477D99F|nr:hypothetical protein [Lacticaseibacillus paracasei]MDH7443956.1 hypothetical protein [Lacticaseibacillus paracasei subsp. paracasei]
MTNKVLEPTIISTDPGIDDAVAIAIALGDPVMDVQLICPIAEMSASKKTLNTRFVTDFSRSINKNCSR